MIIINEESKLRWMMVMIIVLMIHVFLIFVNYLPKNIWRISLEFAPLQFNCSCFLHLSLDYSISPFWVQKLECLNRLECLEIWNVWTDWSVWRSRQSGMSEQTAVSGDLDSLECLNRKRLECLEIWTTEISQSEASRIKIQSVKSYLWWWVVVVVVGVIGK